jgi:uncharacterized DUF497 family protein
MAAIQGFDWDKGNRAKCQEHGVSPAEVEALFKRPLLILPDAAHSRAEERLRAIGKTARGRSVFLVYTVRERGGKRLIRPISARYMHRKEVMSYEKENPGL